MTTFEDLQLSQQLLSSIKKMGFEEATPVQAETIPLSLAGNDVIGQAQTGTGKTVAFGIPLIEKIDPKLTGIQGLIIAPTRELAVQVTEELYKLGYHKRARVLAVFGGQEISRQIRALKKQPSIIVGTPGRLLDHIRRKTLRLSEVNTVILDEADEMLNMGFIEDIESILENVPSEHQTLLFSATMPPPIRKIAERFMKEPQIVRVKAKEMTVPKIQQSYVEVQERQKFDTLTRLLDMQSPELAIVFGRTKRRVDELSKALSIRGYIAEGIHGDLSQSRRLQVLRKGKEGTLDILVATDVAARGLDISGVTHVYNFDVPQDPESYVHRIGRTGRAGKEGAAVTFVTPRELPYLRSVEQVTKRKMDRIKAPSLRDAIEGQQQAIVEQLLETVSANGYTDFTKAAEELLEKEDAVSLVASALHILTKKPEETPVELTPESPAPVKRGGDRGGNSGGRGSYNKRGGKSQKGQGRYKRTQSSDRRRSSYSSSKGGSGRSSSQWSNSNA
ncbi:DEAD/DEAH box helicase [Bacillus fonticola]|uniref:DEAD/DEAH box helicase n=1 Tax=Bacillus fonticola TaxID=2728853 RepID=UPI001473D986|nr:DEAD/DEAH box helicase [Bacillus fonticola]